METRFYSQFFRLVAFTIAWLGFLTAPLFGQDTCLTNSDIEKQCLSIADTMTMNEIQAIGSHNSYKLAIPEPELALIRAYREQSAITLDYSHISLTEQLNLGLRQIELDIVYDPEGGRYADPLLPRQTIGMTNAVDYDNSKMHAPGFKVLHAQDIDVRSTCSTWIDCLTEIKRWSDQNPSHIPILIMFNAKTGASAYPQSITALPFDEKAFDALDQEIESVFAAQQLLSPDDIRGDYSTLREAVLDRGWPNLKSTRGKVLFALDEGPEKVAIYSRGKPSLQGLPVFVNSVSEDADHAAYFTINNPVRDQQRIRSAVRKGFIVRTRADANTLEARRNDTSRREAAFGSGAQYISTDYYLPRRDFSDYSVQFPEDISVRCNPILLNSVCAAP